MKSFNKIAIVTGGSRYVGKSITETLLELNYKVFICARTLNELEETKKEYPTLNIKQLDIRDRVKILEWVSEIIKDNGKVDVLVNNAAVMPPLGKFVDNDLDEWIDTISINLFGTATFCKAVIPSMMQQRNGFIINLGGGGSAYPRADHTAYGCSKAAIVRLTDTLAEELREYNIRVNVLSPGRQYSRMREEDLEIGIPLPDEWDGEEKVKALTRFLVSTDISGKFIHINDDYENFTEEIIKSDLYTLRRINP